MPHYKAPDNSLHFLDDTGFEYLLPEGSVQIASDEAEAIRAFSIPPLAPVQEQNPVEKLKAFLASNPDVAALMT